MQTVEIGEIRVTPIVSARFKLDGGSMFGVVPRALWERKAPPDESNRIALAVNSLIVESGGTLILVEPGMGVKYDERQKEIYGIGLCDPAEAMSLAGFAAEDVDMVILSHLHFDHAGGATRFDEAGLPVPAFPGARYVVQEEEWRVAVDPHPLARGSYIDDDFRPLHDAGILDLVSGDVEVAPGVSVELTGGHTRGHQIVRFHSAGAEAVYAGDLVPTEAHLRLNWLMAWDLDPRTVWNRKASLLDEVSNRGSIMFWSHDPEVFAGRIRQVSPGRYGLVEGSALTSAP